MTALHLTIPQIPWLFLPEDMARCVLCEKPLTDADDSTDSVVLWSFTPFRWCDYVKPEPPRSNIHDASDWTGR